MFTEEEINKNPPMMQAYMRMKNEYPDKFLFYQMGDFFELFFEDAIEAAALLNITLTQRGREKNENAIPMAGVPFHSVDTYVQKVLNAGKSVVLAEQVGEPTPGKGIMERKVSRIVTPGTVLDSGLLEPKDTKYLCSVYERNKTIEVAWVNFASGEVWCSRTTREKVFETINKIEPAEILISNKQIGKIQLPKEIPVSIIDDWEYDLVTAESIMTNIWEAHYLFKFGLPDKYCTPTIVSLINYLKSTQGTEIRHIQNIRWFRGEDFLQVDTTSKQHLEVVSSYSKNNLWTTLDKCSTPMGSRMLKDWLNNPIKKLSILESRLNRIDYLKGEGTPYLSWKGIAKEWCDIERITAKIGLRTVRPRELAALRDTLRTMPKVLAWAEKMPPQIQGMFSYAIPSDAILKVLEKFLLEDPSAWIRDGSVIANGVDSELDEYRNLQTGHSVFLKEFEDREKVLHKIPNLKVDYNSAQGFFIAISNSHLDKVPSHYIRRQTLKNAERYTTEELKIYEAKSLSAKEKAMSLEKALYSKLIDKLQPYISILQKQARVLAEWDILASLAEIAQAEGYCRPTFNNTGKIVMVEGKHPIVSMNSKSFVPNCLELQQEENVAIITGPNMGGKSTLMRQLALLVIMAHIGSYVPAKEFSVPDIDAIFTRIGASDDIANGRSTFMVEMGESAYILNNATSKSLVLLDELGRGTATYDGLSLAWSIAKYLAQRIRAYTLFATHYLEMTELTKELENVKNYRVGAIETEDGIVFTYQIEKGSASRSYGLHVAELAGINIEVLGNAKAKLKELEDSHTVDNHSAVVLYSAGQSNSVCGVGKELAQLNLNAMTAKQALDWLYSKQEQLKNSEG